MSGGFKGYAGAADGDGMEDDPATTTERPTACPSCGAAVRGDVPWCTICYSPLVPEPQPGPPPVQPSAPAVQDDSHHGAGPGEPPTPLGPAEVDALAERMLAQLAANDSTGPAWLDRLPESKGGRTAVIMGATAAAVLVIVVVLTVLGSVL